MFSRCSSGIGEALAREFQARGEFLTRQIQVDIQQAQCLHTIVSSLSLDYRVIATARRPESISHLRETGMTILSLDVTEPESVKAVEAEVERITDGKLDVLVNNA